MVDRWPEFFQSVFSCFGRHGLDLGHRRLPLGAYWLILTVHTLTLTEPRPVPVCQRCAGVDLSTLVVLVEHNNTPRRSNNSISALSWAAMKTIGSTASGSAIVLRFPRARCVLASGCRWEYVPRGDPPEGQPQSPGPEALD